MSDTLAPPGPTAPPAGASVLPRLLPFVLTVFLGFLAIGLPLSVLPLHVHGALGFGAVLVGAVVGLQSVATVLTRRHAGILSDTRGPKRAVLTGLAASALAGVCYGLSLLAPGSGGGLAAILCGRVVLGFGESLFMTGALSWAIAVAGPQNAGKVMSWNGIAMYSAIAVGAPAGLAILEAGGFAALAMAAALAPLAGLAVAAGVPAVPVPGGVRMPFTAVIGRVLRPGLGLAFGTVGFAVLASFAPLLFAARGWDGAGFALTAFGGCYIALRLVAGGLPDKLGGRRVAAVSLLVEAVGQAMVWGAGSPWVAVAGAAVTGLGFSLVLPSLGVEAVKRVPPHNRGVALAAFVAFFDLSIAFAAPVAGALVGSWGYPAVFLAGAAAALLSALVTLTERRA
ncbi:putative MFS family arabinose efflux permease [Azospirillum agricola]|uniref:MFS transporter n=1 Tax=Azospirillum agricola TaxID=1720247 RepID=UPI001AE743A9|nr:MFS transporter [Azospirillum agricola]MBP2232203.1 putative MFS family arabinose efflux permease [Azospirillum agricola]